MTLAGNAEQFEGTKCITASLPHPNIDSMAILIVCSC